jgi:branched-chain amino acid transport system substrate-binding protein
MKSPWKLRTATLGLACTAALALTACSGGVGSSTTTSAPPTTEAAAATTEAAAATTEAAAGTLLIGGLAPFSGSENRYGNYMKTGAQLAVDELNAAGGVLGQQVAIQWEDDACDPTTAASAAQKLVTAGVVASVGGYCSGATLPTIPIFVNAGIPMIIPVANSDNLIAPEAGGDVYLLDGTGSQQAGSAVLWVQKNGWTNLVVIDDKTDYSANLAAGFKTQAEAAGYTVKALALTKGESDFSATVNDILSANADFIYFTGYAQEAGLLVKQAIEAGYSGAILLGDGSVDAKVAEIAGLDLAKEVTATFTMTPDMLDDGGAFAASYAAATGGGEPGPYTLHAYDAVKTWAAAVEAAGSTDLAPVYAALDALSISGLTGPIAFNEDGSRAGSGGFVIVKVSEDGSFKFYADPAE